jgi:hypothetical protein
VLSQKRLQWWVRDFACIVRDGRRCDHRNGFEYLLFFKASSSKGFDFSGAVSILWI